MRTLRLAILALLIFSTSLFAQFGRGGSDAFGGSGSFGRGEDVVESVNQAPEIFARDTTGVENTELVVNTIYATDPDGTIPSILIVDSPGGSFVDVGDGTATLTWTPAVGEAGSYTPSFVASDGALTDTITITITISSAPAFVFSVKTDNAGPSNDDQFLFPLTGTGMDFIAYYSDGSANDTITVADLPFTHTFSASGTDTVTCVGTITGWRTANGGDKLKLLEILEWGTFDVTRDAAFYGNTNLFITATDAPLISGSTLGNMFLGCTNLDAGTGIGDESLWDLVNVTYAKNAFNASTSGFNPAIQNFQNTGSITNWDAILDNLADFDQNLATLNIASMTSAANFMKDATMSVANFDSTLIGWQAQPHQDNVIAHFGSSKYTGGGAAEAAFDQFVLATGSGGDGWTITSGGVSP